MNRNDILNSIDTRLTTHYPPDVVDRTLSRISGTLAELDALPPYPEESDFQSQLTTVFYPFLAAAQALDMEGEDCEVLKELINEIVPASVWKAGALVSGAPRKREEREREGRKHTEKLARPTLPVWPIHPSVMAGA